MTTLSFRVARSLALVLFLGVVGAACGVGPDKGATDIPRSQVPFGLLERTEVEPVNTEPAEEVAALFFVKGDRLEPVFREVATEAAPAEVLEALLVGPTRAEFRSGLRTAVPEATSIGSVKEALMLNSLRPRYSATARSTGSTTYGCSAVDI